MLSVDFNQTIVLLPAIISNPPVPNHQNQLNYPVEYHPQIQFNSDSLNSFTPLNCVASTINGDNIQLEYKPTPQTRLLFSSSSTFKVKCVTDLDDYSLLNILSHIFNIREKIRLKRVCQRFYRLATESLRVHHQSISKRKDVYYSKEIRPFSRNEKRVRLPFDQILINCPNLIEFKSTACDRICYNVTKLPIELINLEKLTLHGWSNVKMASAIVRRCINLKYLDLGCIKMGRSYDNYITDLSMIQSNKLSTLRLHGIHYSLDNLRPFMFSKGINLKSFHYSSSLSPSTSSSSLSTSMVITPIETDFFISLIQTVFNWCPNLNHFELRLVDHDGFGTSLPNLVPLTKLTSMIIKTDRRAFNFDLLETILKHCPSLEYLLIVSNLFNDHEVERLCKKYCPLIKKLTHKPFNWSHFEIN